VTFNLDDLVSMSPFGGIPMRVTAINGDQIKCHWFDVKRRLQIHTFRADLLRPFKRGGAIRVRL
jgi:uncharacterized protein YodC (DUF2158 family)